MASFLASYEQELGPVYLTPSNCRGKGKEISPVACQNQYPYRPKDNKYQRSSDHPSL
jgi:hypothetical protein